MCEYVNNKAKVLLVNQHITPSVNDGREENTFRLINLIGEELRGKNYLQFLGVGFWEAVKTSHSLKYLKEQKLGVIPKKTATTQPLRVFLLSLDKKLVQCRSLPSIFDNSCSKRPFLHMGGERDTENAVSCP